MKDLSMVDRLATLLVREKGYYSLGAAPLADRDSAKLKALAVLEVLYEPTPAMIVAGMDAPFAEKPDGTCLAIWTSMVDAAINGPLRSTEAAIRNCIDGLRRSGADAVVLDQAALEALIDLSIPQFNVKFIKEGEVL